MAIFIGKYVPKVLNQNVDITSRGFGAHPFPQVPEIITNLK